MRNTILHSIFLIAIIFLASCASKRKAGWDQRTDTVKMSKSELKRTVNSAEMYWSKRHEKDQLEKALELYETISKTVESKEDYYKYAVRLCRGYYFLADAHYDDVEKKKSYWNIGTAWGEKAMATNEMFRKEVSKGGDVTDALKHLDKSYTASIYWTAVNLGKWAKSSGIATILKYKNRIRTMVQKVQDFDESFFYGAAHRYWGAYYAVAPGFAGGDINKSKKHFEKSIELAPHYLGTYVLYAQFHDTKKGNKEDFKKRLKQVLNAKVDKVKDITPENIIEQKKAQKLLTEMEELF